jgi:NAD(P)H dehydrogenase (quinone)
MKKVTVVYHSGYGHTAKQAQAVVAGMEAVEGVSAMQIAIRPDGELTKSDWEALDASDAIVFGSPTYMGMVSWQFKKFADATSKRWFSLTWKNKLAAGFTNSASMNGDKHSTIHYFITLAMQHGMIWVGTGMTPANAKSSTRDDINYLGSYAGLLAQSPADASPEEAPPAGDLATATEFGRRIADVTKNLRG